MRKLFFLPLFLLLLVRAVAQDCSSLQLSCTASESRCVATGSITVNASGGSGDYNYKATGPVSTPYTSSDVITGLQAGYYSVYVQDLSTGCVKKMDSVYVGGSYADPRFQLVKTDAGCAGNDGTISTMSQQFGRAPFTYTIIAPSPASVGTSNTTGLFTGLVAGDYSIRLQDSCGGIQVRQVTIESYDWWLDSVSVTRIGCDSAHFFARLKDNKGNSSESGHAFDGFSYGLVMGSDTLWNAKAPFDFLLSKNRNLTIVVKDLCGNLHASPWTLPADQRPSLDPPVQRDFTCSDFTASINNPQHLTNPQYCLFDSSQVQLGCNTDGVFTHLSYGSYCIKTSDACYDTTIVQCFTAALPLPQVAATVAISGEDCASFTAAITGQQHLINPNYCLYDTGHAVLSCNTSGIFPGLNYGSYCIEVTNSCSDTVISRCFTAQKPLPVLRGYAITNADCSSFHLTVTGDSLVQPNYCLYDSLGNVVACDSTGNFSGLAHGSYCIRAVSCGDTTAALCFTSTRPVPSVGPWVNINNIQCSGFTAGIVDQVNLTSPQYCLYDSKDSLLACNTTGVFFNLSFGFYCIKVKDSCTDSTIVRCFTQLRPVPGLDATVQQSHSTCTSFSATVTGTNLTNPQYCAYDNANQLISCNSTGVFDNLPYGAYCFTVHDGCVDTTMRICQTFSVVRGFSVNSSKSCTIGSTEMQIQFAGDNGPFRIRIYHPDGSLKLDTLSSTNPFQVLLPGLPAGTQYKLVGTDACNLKDTVLVTPDASMITKSISVKSKCPSGVWPNGAGDLQVHCTSNFYTTQPAIIKKDGNVFNRSYSSVSSDLYTFSDLEPATYIVAYTMQGCNSILYDTVTVRPYAYPSQGQSAIYQCDNSSLSLSSDVKGGVSPFNFQIIGSNPESPDITTGVQNSPVFSINTGTLYSLVRMRAIDACGNATLDDVSLLPLQNVTVKASQLCFYQNTTLTVDTIHNASYEWYKKTSATDSTLIGSGLSYNLPFFVPEEVGQYVCKVDVNNGCLMRYSSFTLDGQCGYSLLPISLQLKGREAGGVNQLSWEVREEKNVSAYILQKKEGDRGTFQNLANLAPKNLPGGSFYSLADPASTKNSWYRLKMLYRNGTADYSNIVLMMPRSRSRVYPNPARGQVFINLSAERPSAFLVQLFDMAGRRVYAAEQKDIVNTTLVYRREAAVSKGVYLIRITNTTTGLVESFRVVLE
ncbi:MAG: T9SS type A sorting domain-containing protein [Flavisolibacter sp.]